MDGLKYLSSSEDGSSNESVPIADDLDQDEDYVMPQGSKRYGAEDIGITSPGVSCPEMNDTIDYKVHPHWGITRCNDRPERFVLADFGVERTSKKLRGTMKTTPKDEFDGGNAGTKMRGDKESAGGPLITPGKLLNSPQGKGQIYSTMSDCFSGQRGRDGISEGKEGGAVMKHGGSVCPTTAVHGSKPVPRRLNFDNIQRESSVDDPWVLTEVGYVKKKKEVGLISSGYNKRIGINSEEFEDDQADEYIRGYTAEKICIKTLPGVPKPKGSERAKASRVGESNIQENTTRGCDMGNWRRNRAQMPQCCGRKCGRGILIGDWMIKWDGPDTDGQISCWKHWKCEDPTGDSYGPTCEGHKDSDTKVRVPTTQQRVDQRDTSKVTEKPAATSCKTTTRATSKGQGVEKPTATSCKTSTRVASEGQVVQPITPEQRERIKRNKERAKKIRQTRRDEIQRFKIGSERYEQIGEDMSNINRDEVIQLGAIGKKHAKRDAKENNEKTLVEKTTQDDEDIRGSKTMKGPTKTVNRENMTMGRQKVKGDSKMQVSDGNNEADEARVEPGQESELNVNEVMCSNNTNHDAREPNEIKTNESHKGPVERHDQPTSPEDNYEKDSFLLSDANEDEITTFHSNENSSLEGSEPDLDESTSNDARYTGEEYNESEESDTEENDMNNRSHNSGQSSCKRSVRRSKRIVNAIKKPRYDEGYDENSDSRYEDDYESNDYDIDAFGDDGDSATSIRTLDDQKGKSKVAAKGNGEELTENDGNKGVSWKVGTVMYNDNTKLRGGRSGGGENCSIQTTIPQSVKFHVRKNDSNIFDEE